jgi:hypothetical protein
VLARALEENGLPTTTLVLVKEHAQRVKPPRALFVPFPYGYALGRPNDPAFQHRVIAAALDLFKATSAPVLAEFPESGDGPAVLLQASAAPQAPVSTDAADEITQWRRSYERWVEEHAGRTQVGATGVPQRRFRGLVRFLQAYLTGAEADYPERPQETPVPLFIRRSADDLKAFMIEARMAQRPQDTDNALYAWFWGETAVGALLRQLAAKFREQGDERTAAGIAR